MVSAPTPRTGDASNPAKTMTQWQDIVRAADLPAEDLAGVLDTLLERMGLKIVREQTPDYTSYELQPLAGMRATLNNQTKGTT